MKNQKGEDCRVTLGMLNMDVTSRILMHDDDIYPPINYLELEFYQHTDTGGKTTIRINGVTRKEVKALARAISKVAENLK